jgi:hypothetical protein
LAEGSLQGLGETRVGGGESGGVGDDSGHGVSFCLEWMERPPEDGVSGCLWGCLERL